MNAIEHAINRLLISDIPALILEDGFTSREDRNSRRRKTIESQIRELVVEAVIKPDFDAIGGVMLQMNLNGVPYEKMRDFSRVYVIPKTLTMGRSIVQVNRVSLNITSNYAERQGGQVNTAWSVSPFERSIQSVVASNKPIPNVTNAEIEILGDNVIKINDYQNFSADVNLECRIGYTDDLIEIKKPYYKDFSELLNVAVKAYLYRTLALKIDRTRLEGGRDFGRYRDFVESWADAAQMYNDLIDQKWYQILLLNDPGRKNKSIMSSGKFRV